MNKTIEVIPFNTHDAKLLLERNIERVQCFNCDYQIAYQPHSISQRQQDAFTTTIKNLNRSVGLIYDEVDKIMGAGFSEKVFKDRIDTIYEELMSPSLKLIDK